MEAYICITNTGTTPLTGFTIFSNVDNYQTPIISNVPISNFIPPQCPYVLSGVPENATTLRLFCFTGETGGCCIDIPYSDGFNLCDICTPLGFSDNSSPSVGSISVGQLTGGCDPSIENYYLTWFGPGTGSTQQVFTSGLGTGYGVYQYTHPLTGQTSIYQYAGEYRPVIYYMEADGLTYSLSFGAYGDCFQDNPFVVLPYTAANGSSTNTYQHCVEFNSETFIPPNFNGTVELSATTNYVPYRFNSGPQADLMRIYFSGANYLTPILVESLILGSFVNSTPLQTNFNVNLPSFDYKTWGSPQTFTKVLCLTGLTRSANDVLLFDINPQGTESPTSFSFCFTQLQNFDCEMCALTSQNTDYKIQTSTVSAATGTCGSLTIQFNVSGCSTNADQNEDLYKYIFSGSGSAGVGNAYGSVQKNITINNQGISSGGFDKLFNILPTQPTAICGEVTLARITFDVSVSSGIRTVNIRASNIPNTPGLNYVQNIYTSFYENLNAAISNNYYNNSDPNSANYWSVITLYTLPYFEFSTNPFLQQYAGCNLAEPEFYYDPLWRTGDYEFSFAAPTVVVTSGITNPGGANEFFEVTIQGSNFTVSPYDTIIPNTYPPSPCNNSTVSGPFSTWDTLSGIVTSSLINTSFDAVGAPITASQKITHTSNPWGFTVPRVLSTTPLYSASTFNKLSMYQYENKTYPLTGTSGNYGVKFSESAITCPNITTYTFDENSGTTTLNNYVKYHYYYTARIQNILDNTKYDLLATPILANGQPNFNTAPILIGSGDTVGSSFFVIDGSYFI